MLPPISGYGKRKKKGMKEKGRRREWEGKGRRREWEKRKKREKKRERGEFSLDWNVIRIKGNGRRNVERERKLWSRRKRWKLERGRDQLICFFLFDFFFLSSISHLSHFNSPSKNRFLSLPISFWRVSDQETEHKLKRNKVEELSEKEKRERTKNKERKRNSEESWRRAKEKLVLLMPHVWFSK